MTIYIWLRCRFIKGVANIQINVEKFERLLESKGMTQHELAKRSGLGEKTIGRVKRGGDAHARTVDRIAAVLGATRSELMTAPLNSNPTTPAQKAAGDHRVSVLMIAGGPLNYDLVAHRYHVTSKSIMDAAPLLFALLAEMSLQERRQRLAEFESAVDEAVGIAPRHLKSAYIANNDLFDAVAAENRSIAVYDLSGGQIEEDDWADQGDQTPWQDKSGDLFISFLNRLTERTNLDLILSAEGALHPIKGAANNIFVENLLADDLFGITGGDRMADFALRRRFARIDAIPVELRQADRTEDRVAWLVARIPDKQRQEHQDRISVSDNFGDSGL